MRETLEANLDALTRTHSDLGRRLRWPAESAHVEQDDDGTWRRKGVALSLTSKELGTCATRAAEHSEIAVLGVGPGELLACLLECHPALRIYAWDRDPWLLRLTLASHDLTSALYEGRLQLALGSDLIDWIRHAPAAIQLWHPRLQHIYRMEQIALSCVADGRRALVGLDQLLCEEIAFALRAAGWTPCPIDLRAWSLEELDRCVRRLAPELLISINYVHGLAEFCRDRGLCFVCWEVDPTTETLPPVSGPTEHCHMYTYRKSHIVMFDRAGFSHVQYLPLAGAPERAPREWSSPSDAPRIAFVGSSLAPEAERARQQFLQAYTRWRGVPNAERAWAEHHLELAVSAQLGESDPRILEAALLESFEDFIADARRDRVLEDPVALAWQLAAAQIRRRRVASLAEFGIHVWGDPGWRTLGTPGVHYRGYAGHHIEVPQIYRSAWINLDVGRSYQADIITLRVFDVLACGGFVLAERSADLSELFEIGRDIDAYSDDVELREKVEFYLSDARARSELAERGRKRVLRQHTVGHRLRTMFAGAGLIDSE